MSNYIVIYVIWLSIKSLDQDSHSCQRLRRREIESRTAAWKAAVLPLNYLRGMYYIEGVTKLLQYKDLFNCFDRNAI
jgi:hypothetical protein